MPKGNSEALEAVTLRLLPVSRSVVSIHFYVALMQRGTYACLNYSVCSAEPWSLPALLGNVKPCREGGLSARRDATAKSGAIGNVRPRRSHAVNISVRILRSLNVPTAPQCSAHLGTQPLCCTFRAGGNGLSEKLPRCYSK